MMFGTACQTGSMKAADTKMIPVMLNGEQRQVPEGLNVLQLLESLEMDPSRVAVELNRSIVHKADWPATLVAGGAQIEIVWFVGGG
jgi:thiamine biosynthesis protein ThiS